MNGLEKNKKCWPETHDYVPGQLTDPAHRHSSHTDLVLGIYQRQIDNNKGRGYPRYRDDFLGPDPDECRCNHEKAASIDENKTFCTVKEKPRKKNGLSAPYLAAAKNFVFAKKLHKENLEHKPLPDTIADAMYRKAQLMGGEPGLMLKDGNYATGVGWKGYPGYGATRCTKLKVYRPKTCVHTTETAGKKRPNSVSSFDKKWRFIRQQKVTPIELAVCWDMSPANPEDEPKRPVHIDGSNGSEAPAVFTLVRTPKENIERIEFEAECNCSPNKIEDFGRIKRAKSAYNFHKNSHRSNLDNDRKCRKSTPNLTSFPKEESKKKKPEEFKAAFRAGVPNERGKCVSAMRVAVPRQRDPYKTVGYRIKSLAPPFSFQTGKRHEYPDHWRLASVYQHSYKPLHLRKRSLLASIFH